MSNVQIVPTWEAAATIFTQNLLYGIDESLKEISRKELIKIGKHLDSVIQKHGNHYLGDTVKKDDDDIWDCQP